MCLPAAPALLQAAGSAEAFKKVDLHYVEATARAAVAGGVPQFGLVSAQGARAGIWASDWKPFHGLLYAKCKGLVRPVALGRGGCRGELPSCLREPAASLMRLPHHHLPARALSPSRHSHTSPPPTPPLACRRRRLSRRSASPMQPSCAPACWSAAT